ncbi:Serpentine Receptor, class Z [Caenorhabditis elegans]|uniref:Serpentine Receptor, class Z n=1 Tax=Caenorhabditis elegans TaxID=6239 RepID=Q5WRK6_CAEEL|nr:Serpentine Receptor, class Z [Caenorhabditis elegans]CAH60794.1 Serpentine Receptor, class Z [Caenorhabditis elegans]|eukprot:NP_001023588.1 Serpentine Receptor, class Z [Caenorhabditis elegans]
MSNSSEFINYVISQPTVSGFIAMFLTFTLFYLITFPFYVIAFKLNRTRDRNTLLFPTVGHVYNMVTITFYLFVSFIICMSLFMNSGPELSNLILFIIVALITFALYLSTEAFHFLIFLLAAQRFLVFYFPSTEKHIALFQKFMSKKVWYVHLVSVVKEITIICIVGSQMEIKRPNIRCIPAPGYCQDTWSGIGFYTVGFILFFHVLLFLSIPFYIPIMISAQKISSNQYCKVQNYIHWQTLTIFVCKLINIVVVIYNHTFGSLSIAEYTVVIVIIDIVTTPLIVQLSYLGSNGVSFQWRTFFRELFGGEGSSTVAPQLDN